MYEKVNPAHPDKIADRIAGAIVDIAYKHYTDPRVAVEVLIGHGICYVIAETSGELPLEEIGAAVQRIAPGVVLEYTEKQQDEHLAKNQDGKIRCGDNGIFRGVPVTEEQLQLTDMAKLLYKCFPSDGKYILDGDRKIICQSNAKTEDIKKLYEDAEINPLGEWTGGPDVDTGATNRKLGSDLADSVTGGGIHGKDLSKADVSITIYAWLKAQTTQKVVEYSCAIGDETVDGIPYSGMVEIARHYINSIGGFEKLAEWGLVR